MNNELRSKCVIIPESFTLYLRKLKRTPRLMNEAHHFKEIIMGEKRRHGYEVAKTGITFGTALAITISWSLHKSLIWAIVHGFFSWFYVIYYWITR